MRRFRQISRLAVVGLPLALVACEDIDWSRPVVPDVSNASNGQPQAASSLPRGASSFGNPPNAMRVPGSLSRTYNTN